LEIISVSIDKKTLDEVDRIQEKLGFKSRSKLLRATINSLLNEYRLLDSLKGHSDSVITVTYQESDKNRISSVVHKFEEAVKTTVHQHHNGMCIDIMVVCCDAEDVRKLFSALKSEKGVKSISCSIL
jgi:metal-responsive CopG/Arc/MetJ family transcriptional regulator